MRAAARIDDELSHKKRPSAGRKTARSAANAARAARRSAGVQRPGRQAAVAASTDSALQAAAQAPDFAPDGSASPATAAAVPALPPAPSAAAADAPAPRTSVICGRSGLTSGAGPSVPRRRRAARRPARRRPAGPAAAGRQHARLAPDSRRIEMQLERGRVKLGRRARSSAAAAPPPTAPRKQSVTCRSTRASGAHPRGAQPAAPRLRAGATPRAIRPERKKQPAQGRTTGRQAGDDQPQRASRPLRGEWPRARPRTAAATPPAAPSRCASANHTSPPALSGVPPSGPAMPVMATASVRAAGVQRSGGHLLGRRAADGAEGVDARRRPPRAPAPCRIGIGHIAALEPLRAARDVGQALGEPAAGARFRRGHPAPPCEQQRAGLDSQACSARRPIGCHQRHIDHISRRLIALRCQRPTL